MCVSNTLNPLAVYRLYMTGQCTTPLAVDRSYMTGRVGCKRPLTKKTPPLHSRVSTMHRKPFEQGRTSSCMTLT